MFISKLIHTVETYDPYGLHRVNGIKVVYVLLVLFAVNGLFYIPDSYFYFFYIPITAMTAEVQGQTIRRKYELFLLTTVGTICMVYIFNFLFPLPLFFLLMAFVMTFFMYTIVLRKHEASLFLVPIILSLVSYSLNYRDVNGDLYAIFNHSLTTLLATFVILGALILFPLRFYYKIWLKTLRAITTLCLNNFKAIQQGENTKDDTRHTIQLITASRMVPRQMPTYSLSKITILMHEIYLLSYLAAKPPTQLSAAQVQHYIDHLILFLDALHQEKPCPLMVIEDTAMLKVIQSWNYLCLNS